MPATQFVTAMLWDNSFCNCLRAQNHDTSVEHAPLFMCVSDFLFDFFSCFLSENKYDGVCVCMHVCVCSCAHPYVFAAMIVCIGFL